MKKSNEIDGNKIFDEILNESKEEAAFIKKSLQIATHINDVLESRNMLQKEFALKMGKSEAEISKWLSGFHNFTIKTIANIEVALGESIIITPNQISAMTEVIDVLISRINSSDTTWPTLDFKTTVDAKPVVPITKVLSISNASFKDIEYTESTKNIESYLPTGT